MFKYDHFIEHNFLSIVILEKTLQNIDWYCNCDVNFWGLVRILNAYIKHGNMEILYINYANNSSRKSHLSQNPTFKNIQCCALAFIFLICPLHFSGVERETFGEI